MRYLLSYGTRWVTFDAVTIVHAQSKAEFMLRAAGAVPTGAKRVRWFRAEDRWYANIYGSQSIGYMREVAR